MQRTSGSRFGRVAACALVGACSAACDRASDTATVLVASSVRAPIEAAFAADESVRVASGPSNAIAMQVLAGAPAHVVVLAHPAWIDRLEEEGLVVERRVLARNALVVAVPDAGRTFPAVGATDDDDALETADVIARLVDSRFERVAIAAPGVPLGTYAREALAHAGVLERLEARGALVSLADARRVAMAVERGEVDAGITYASDAAATAGVRVLGAVDPDRHAPIVVVAALLRADETATERESILAREAYERLFEAGARRALAGAGFLDP